MIKNPVSDHLPVGCMKIGTSFGVPKVSDLRELVPTAEPVTIVVGAFAHGSVSACIPTWSCKNLYQHRFQSCSEYVFFLLLLSRFWWVFFSPLGVSHPTLLF